MVDLLNKYTSEYSSDSHLESLAGVFAVIEIYQNDLSNLTSKRPDQGDPSSLAGAAVSGAIIGAIWGFKLGSWLGPAGSVLGTVGGAIAGATISAIVNIGIQAATSS